MLTAARNAGNDVIGYSRRPAPRAGFVEMRAWQPVREADFSGLDGLIHLAGENLLGLWTKKKRDSIYRSRVDDTRALIARLRELPQPPRVLVSAGGSSYYGDAGEGELTEAAAPGSGFISEVARAWEEAAMKGSDFMRVVTMRTGVVLGADGGAVPALRLLFKLALGGRLGNGRQWMPWVHVTDLARLFLFAVENEALRGPVNGAAPGCVRNSDFTRSVAAAVNRPAIFPAPAFLLRLLPGGMGDIFLHSQRLVPEAAQAAGFAWLFPEISTATKDVFDPA